MARIRSIHPGLFTDEAFVQLSCDAQMLLIGLWTEADDQGIFEWKPITLRMRLRPTKDGALEPLLAEMTALNIIRQYEVDGRQLGAVRNFRKWQKPKFPNETHLITDDIRIYVGLGTAITENKPPHAAPLQKQADVKSTDYGNGAGPTPSITEMPADEEAAFPPIAENPSLMERRGEEMRGEKENNNTPEGGRDGDFSGNPPGAIPESGHKPVSVQHGLSPPCIKKTAEKRWFFEGRMGRVLEKDTVAWAKSYHTLTPDDALSVLQNCDDYFFSLGKPEPKMFFRFSAWLKKEHDRRLLLERGDETLPGFS